MVPVAFYSHNKVQNRSETVIFVMNTTNAFINPIVDSCGVHRLNNSNVEVSE